MAQHTKTGGSVYNMEKPQEKVCNRSGKHIREARTKAGMTQTQLADALRKWALLPAQVPFAGWKRESRG